MNNEKSICIILNKEIEYYKQVNDCNIYITVLQNTSNQPFTYRVLGRKRERNNLIVHEKMEIRLEIPNEVEEDVVEFLQEIQKAVRNRCAVVASIHL